MLTADAPMAELVVTRFDGRVERYTVRLVDGGFIAPTTLEIGDEYELRQAAPKASKAALLSSVNDAALLDLDARLDTGMKVREAVERASRWWDAQGRHAMARRVGASTETGFVPSGILQGRAWDALTKDERAKVVKVHHHMTVRRPDRLDVDPDAPFALGRGERVN